MVRMKTCRGLEASFKKSHGQTVIMVLLTIPLILTLLGVGARATHMMFIHWRLENLCNKRVLDALAHQGQGIEQLARLNQYAQFIIDQRRQVDAMLAASGLSPQAYASLRAAQKILKQAQKFIDIRQKAIQTKANISAHNVLTRPLPIEYQKKVRTSFTPNIPNGPHAMGKGLVLHVTEWQNYRGETGAPLRLDSDFADRQKISTAYFVRSESLLPKWDHRHQMPDLTLTCRARLKMKQMEDSWIAQLEKPTARPLWN